MKEHSIWTKDYIYICISNFFLFMTFYLLMAILPMFVINKMNGSEQQAGLTMTLFLIGSVLFRPLAGKLLDEFQKKKLLLISLPLFAAASIMYVNLENLLLLLVLRFVHGITFSLANTTLSSIAADLISEDRKGEGLGYYTTFMSMAMAIGPFLGLTIIQYYEFKFVFIMSAIFALLSFLFGSLVHIHCDISKREIRTQESSGLKRIFEPNVIPVAIIGSFLSFAYAGISTFSSIYAKEIGIGTASSYFFISYALALIVSRAFVGKLFDRSGPNMVVYPSMILFALGIITLGIAGNIFVFLISAAIIGVGNGTLYATLQTMAILSTSKHRTGVAISTYFLFYDIGMGMGAYILGMVVAHASFRSMYFLCALIVLVSAVIYYIVYNVKYASRDCSLRDAE